MGFWGSLFGVKITVHGPDAADAHKALHDMGIHHGLGDTPFNAHKLIEVDGGFIDIGSGDEVVLSIEGADVHRVKEIIGKLKERNIKWRIK